LLTPEGINLFIAGERPAVGSLLGMIRNIPGIETLEAKFSESEEQPFNRMLVKLKKEIIAFGVKGINPARHTSPRLPAKELKRWLDEGRPVTLLDTRNTYEVKLGTFAGAVTLPIRHFRKFPEAVDALPEELKQTPVVSFCTGGIRCEKAAPYLERSGLPRSLPARGRHPEILRGMRRGPLAGGVFRLRQTRRRRSGIAGNRQPTLLCLPGTADRGGSQGSEIRL